MLVGAIAKGWKNWQLVKLELHQTFAFELCLEKIVNIMIVQHVLVRRLFRTIRIPKR